MALRQQILAFLATVERKPITSQEKKLTAAQQAKLVPTGGQGGGSGSVHWQSDHLTHTALLLAVSRPADVDREVRLWDSLPYRGSNPPGLPAPGGHHLGSVVGGTFAKIALHFSRGESLTPESEAIIRSWRLTLGSEPPYAQMTMDDGSGRIDYFFHSGRLEDVPVRRLTVLTGEVLLGFSKLLADTYIHENSIKAIQFLDATKPSKLGQEDESTGDHLRQEAGPVPLSDRPLAKGSDSLNASEAICGCDNPQERKASGRDGHCSQNELDLTPS